MTKPQTKHIRGLPSVKEVMKEKDIRPIDISIDLNMCLATVYKAMNCGVVGRNTAKAIAKYLGVNQAYLFESVRK